MTETSPVVAAWGRLVAVADRLDRAAAAGRCSPRLVPGMWAGLKLAAMALAAPALGAWVGGRVITNQRRTRVLADAFPAVVDAILAGGPHDFPVARVARIDAGARWFVASDLHRAPAGYLDWPERQGTRGLYDAALDHYADGGWGLVENGDIEDFWMVGGSAYGVSYEIGRMVAALAPGAAGVDLRAAVTAEHLARIMANYRGTYARVDGFHRRGRFVRVTGNHDDCFERPDAAAAFVARYPASAPVDFVVLEDGDTPVGVICHGHQTDAWNGPAVPNAVARFMTSLASALDDQPIVPIAPGVPDARQSRRLLGGRAANRLTRVNGLVGANTGLESLDEVALFDAFRRAAGGGPAGDLDGGPWLIMGHTHVPLAGPCHPGDGGRWGRYHNGGSGITPGLVTGVEWDGEAAPRRPTVRLVGWVPDDGPAGSARRVVFDGGGSTLTVRGDRATAGR